MSIISSCLLEASLRCLCLLVQYICTEQYIPVESAYEITQKQRALAGRLASLLIASVTDASGGELPAIATSDTRPRAPRLWVSACSARHVIVCATRGLWFHFISFLSMFLCLLQLIGGLALTLTFVDVVHLRHLTYENMYSYFCAVLVKDEHIPFAQWQPRNGSCYRSSRRSLEGMRRAEAEHR